MSNNIFEQHGFKIDKKGKFFYEVYKGFHMFILLNEPDRTNAVIMSVKSENFENEAAFQAFLEQYCQKEKKMKYFTYVNQKLNAHFKLNSFDSILQFVEECTNFLNQHNFSNCCSNCFTKDFLADYKLNGIPATLCTNCFNRIKHTDIYANEENQKKIKPHLGMIGALIGAFIGVLIWIVVYHSGYIAGIAGFAIAALAIKGYEKLGGGINKLGAVICLIITIFMVFAAQYSAIAFEIYLEYNQSIGTISFIESFIAVFQILMLGDLTGGFVIDLIMGYAFTAVASFSLLKRTFQTVILFSDEAVKLD